MILISCEKRIDIIEYNAVRLGLNLKTKIKDATKKYYDHKVNLLLN